MKMFSLGPDIYYGSNSTNYLTEFSGKCAFIVTDQTMIKLGIVARITNTLKQNNIDFHIFSEVEPDPSLETVLKGVIMLLDVKPDSIIAIGGGSPIDAAKAMMLYFVKLNEQITPETMEKPYFIAIPTTSGTGSEVTSYSVITNNETHIKMPLSDPLMLPDVAILDEELTKTVPDFVTADTGIDVLTHAIEAYVSPNSSEFTDIYAEKAIKLVFENLQKVFENGEDLDGRRKLHIASCMAGIAFTNATLGINHSLAHSIGAKFHISHGRSNAILLPYVIAYNSGLTDHTMNHSETAKRYMEISRSIGLPAYDTGSGVKSLINAISQLNRSLKIPNSFKEFGIDEKIFMDEVGELSSHAFADLCTGGNPRKVTEDEMAGIYKDAFFGKKGQFALYH